MKFADSVEELSTRGQPRAQRLGSRCQTSREGIYVVKSHAVCRWRLVARVQESQAVPEGLRASLEMLCSSGGGGHCRGAVRFGQRFFAILGCKTLHSEELKILDISSNSFLKQYLKTLKLVRRSLDIEQDPMFYFCKHGTLSTQRFSPRRDGD